MIHTIIYHGRYSLNYNRLLEKRDNPNLFMILDPDGKEKPLYPHSKKVDGIKFGYMEKSKEGLLREKTFFAVRVDNIILNKPLLINPEQHTDKKWFGPQSSQFEDKSAKKLLCDIIQANPGQRADLTKLYNRYFEKP